MDAPAERRRFPRLNTLGAPYRASFEAGGGTVEVRLANLSAGGCGLELPMALARGLDVGSLLQGLRLDHPDLPLVPLEGSVVRLLGKIPGKTAGYALAGVEFTAVTPFVQMLIHGHVLQHLELE